MQFGECLESVQKTVLAVHIYNVDSSSVLCFRKPQVHQIRWNLPAPNSQMLALISKYIIDARIGGWCQATYLEFEPDAPENLDTHE